MDPLSDLLAGPRARGAFVLRCDLEPPWALRVEDRAPVTVVVVVEGTAWVVPDGAPARVLGAGDVAVLRGPEPYVVADDPGTEPQALIDADQRCTTLDGVEVPLSWQGTRVWGNSPHGSTTMLTGTYSGHGARGGRLLDALLPLTVVSGNPATTAVAALLAEEVSRSRPGQEAVLDRLLDVLLVAALRAWFDGPDGAAPGWYTAAADPVVGPVLRLLQDRPDQAWTIEALAGAVAVSRATLARRFTRLVGQPPMTHLATWRLDLAADLLLEPDATVAAVARRVGYGSPFALSTAFTRRFGVSPRDHRRNHDQRSR